MGDHKRRIVKNTFANASAQIVALVASFVFMPLLISHFGVTDYGLYVLAISVASYAYLLDLGVGTTLQKRIAERSAQDDLAGIGKLVSSGLTFYMGVGLVAAAAILVVAFLSQTVFSVSASSADLLRILLIVAAVQSLLQWPLSTANHVLAGLQEYTTLARTSLVATVVQISAMAAVLLAGQGPLAMLMATALTSLGAGAFNWWYARKALAGVHISPKRADKSTMRGIFLFSWPFFVSQLCAFIIYQQTDRLVLVTFVGAAAVGLYEAAGKFQGFISQVLGFANSAVMPMASHLDAGEQHDSIRTLFVRGTKYTLAVSLPVTLCLIVFARPLILHWLGPLFLPVVFSAQLIVSHQLLTAGNTVGGNIIIGKGAFKERLPFTVGMAVLNLVLSLILVKPLGILGVVLGTVIPYYLDFPFGLYYSLKHARVSFRDWSRSVALPAYPPLLLPLALGLLLLRTTLTSNLIGTAIAMALCVGLYWITFFAVSLNASERREISVVIRAAARRFRPAA